MIKAVVFDLDDTLISEYEYIRSGFSAVSEIFYEKYHLKIYDELLELFQQDKKYVFNRLLIKHGMETDESRITEMVSIYHNHIPKVNYSEGVLLTLTELKNRGLKLGIITDGYYITQKNKLNVLNADEVFDKIIITDEMGRDYWKPNPKAFEIMRDYFNIQFDEMMYIGDNPEKDFYIGGIYPVQTVRLDNHEGVYHNKEYYRDVKEKFRINHIKELFGLLNVGTT